MIQLNKMCYRGKEFKEFFIWMDLKYRVRTEKGKWSETERNKANNNKERDEFC